MWILQSTTNQAAVVICIDYEQHYHCCLLQINSMVQGAYHKTGYFPVDTAQNLTLCLIQQDVYIVNNTLSIIKRHENKM